jgi:hypothetical protein
MLCVTMELPPNVNSFVAYRRPLKAQTKVLHIEAAQALSLLRIEAKK